jgi:hypothetical protein
VGAVREKEGKREQVVYLRFINKLIFVGRNWEEGLEMLASAEQETLTGWYGACLKTVDMDEMYNLL